MLTIHKFSLGHGITEAELKEPATILSADTDPLGRTCYWFLTDTEETRTVKTKLLLTGTGWPIDLFEVNELLLGKWKFLNTIKQDSFMWHVFYRQTKE